MLPFSVNLSLVKELFIYLFKKKLLNVKLSSSVNMSLEGFVFKKVVNGKLSSSVNMALVEGSLL